MNAIEYLLDGLEEALKLERELGVRTLVCDRAVLEYGKQVLPAPVPVPAPAPAPEPVSKPEPVSEPAPAPGPAPSSATLVFVHDRPLSSGGVEMMAKIITALGLTEREAPVIVAPPLSKARAYVVLGARALNRYFPGKPGAPGMRFTTESGAQAVITYSPEYILRYKTVTPALKKIKMDMWCAIKQIAGLTREKNS